MNLRCTLFFWSIHHAALLNSDKCFFVFFFPTISRPMFPSNTTLKISTVLLLTTETQQAVPLPFIYPLGTFPNYYCYSLHISWERPQVLSSPSSQSCPMTVLSLLLPTAACHFVLCPLRCFYCVFTSQEKKKRSTQKRKNTSNAILWFWTSSCGSRCRETLPPPHNTDQSCRKSQKAKTRQQHGIWHKRCSSEDFEF